MKRLFLLSLSISLSVSLKAQHTFSIVAVDPITGEVGGAGATCYQTVNDIADCHPGVGFIHTQSYVNYTNQTYAHNLMVGGSSPQEIMDSLQANDAQNQPQLRQYAAVDLVNGGRAAAFTGTSCFNYKGQRVGSTYAIAGNILLGPQILDSMEARFNATQGSLAQKLMAAMQGAKVIGADSRCLDDSVSSLSAYIIVAKPGDTAPNYYLNLNIENVYPTDPIDALQVAFNAWETTVGVNQNTSSDNEVVLFPNPGNNLISISKKGLVGKVLIEFYTLDGSRAFNQYFAQNDVLDLNIANLNSGLYFVKISAENKVVSRKFIKL